MTKEKTFSKDDLEKWFDKQLEVLRNGVSQWPTLNTLSKIKEDVTSLASAMSFTKGNLPFLLVVPHGWRSVLDLLGMITSGETGGYSIVYPTSISNVVPVSEDPYVIFDIEDGRSMCGKAPFNPEILKTLNNQSRRYLTVDEALNLAIQTDALVHHTLILAGSRYIAEGVPILDIEKRPDKEPVSPGVKQPILRYIPAAGLDNISHIHWGAPSCSKYIEIK